MQAAIDKAPLGRALKEMDAIQRLLDKTDFTLCTALEAVVTPEMRKKTPRYQRWCEHPDADFTRMREELVSVMADYYQMRDKVEEGGGSASALAELTALRKRADAAVANIDAWLAKHSAQIHNPYK